MHGGPAVEPVTHIRGNTCLPGDGDQTWNETMIAFVMNRRRKANDRCSYAACRQRCCGFLGFAGKGGIGFILFCCQSAVALQKQGPASDEERAVRARKHGAESFNRAPIRLCSGAVVVEVMDEG